MRAERAEEDWNTVKVTGMEFAGYGGPGNLNELLVRVVERLR